MSSFHCQGTLACATECLRENLTDLRAALCGFIEDDLVVEEGRPVTERHKLSATASGHAVKRL